MTVLVSVLMAVYNGSRFIQDAVESILGQSHDKIEFIIVDDGSDDNTLDILSRYRDIRIKLIKAPHGGQTAALNKALEICSADFIALMDADDVAERNRLADQLQFLLRNPGVAMLCSDITCIDEYGSTIGLQVAKNVDNASIRNGLLFKKSLKPIIHSTVMIRRGPLVELGGYRKLDPAADVDLWLRAIDSTNIYRMSDRLVRYRIHTDSLSRSFPELQVAKSCMAAVNYLINREFAIDLYAERPLVFRRLSAIAEARIATEKSASKLRLRAWKQQIMRQRPIQLLARACAQILPDGSPVFPNLALGRRRRLVRELCDMAKEDLKGDPNAPLGLDDSIELSGRPALKRPAPVF